jgi:hypothetical protein
MVSVLGGAESGGVGSQREECGDCRTGYCLQKSPSLKQKGRPQSPLLPRPDTFPFIARSQTDLWICELPPALPVTFSGPAPSCSSSWRFLAWSDLTPHRVTRWRAAAGVIADMCLNVGWINAQARAALEIELRAPDDLLA